MVAAGAFVAPTSAVAADAAPCFSTVGYNNTLNFPMAGRLVNTSVETQTNGPDVSLPPTSRTAIRIADNMNNRGIGVSAGAGAGVGAGAAAGAGLGIDGTHIDAFGNGAGFGTGNGSGSGSGYAGDTEATAQATANADAKARAQANAQANFDAIDHANAQAQAQADAGAQANAQSSAGVRKISRTADGDIIQPTIFNGLSGAGTNPNIRFPFCSTGGTFNVTVGGTPQAPTLSTS